MLSVTSDELIAREASHHASCYKNYAVTCYKKEKEKNLTEQEKALNSTFELVKRYLNELKLNPKVVKFSVITKLYEESLKEAQFDEKYIQSLKNNLKRKINQSFPMLQFGRIDSSHLICYPDTLSIDALAKSFYCI